MQMPSPHRQTGAATMAYSSVQPQPDAPESFNQPKRFLADVKNLDLQKIIWQTKRKALHTQPDGVEVRILFYDDSMFGKTYIEDITHQKSPFRYRNTYNEKGDLIFKRVFFYDTLLYDICEFINEKCKPRNSYPYSPGMNPAIPITHTRTAVLNETEIDLYDVSVIKQVYFSSQGKKHYCRIRTDFDESLADAESGKLLFRRRILTGYETVASIPGELVSPESNAYLKSEKMLERSLGRGDSITQVYRKVDTRDTERFYEVFVENARDEKSTDRTLASFLLDHTKEKILYRCKAYRYILQPGGMPFVEFWDEYEQHLKMIDAEK
jgi:hypothetical protein